MLRFALFACVAAVAACSPPAQTAPEAPVAETAPAVTIVVSTPTAGARVTSPLRVEGVAPGDWFFEAVFPVELRGADGQVLAQAPAQAQRDWMTEAPVPYLAELQFSVAQETQATLVLQEDMPGDAVNPRELVIPVILVPAN